MFKYLNEMRKNRPWLFWVGLPFMLIGGLFALGVIIIGFIAVFLWECIFSSGGSSTSVPNRNRNNGEPAPEWTPYQQGELDRRLGIKPYGGNKHNGAYMAGYKKH